MMRDDNPTVGLPVVSPTNMLPVQVVQREIVAPDVVSVSIVLPGTGQAPAPYLPGQFVTLALPTPRETLYRSYSLCGAGDASEPWQITIKRMEMGAVSTYFYNSVREGTLLYSSLPRGTFTLPAHWSPDSYFVFIAVGSGITPIMGMLRALAILPPSERPLVQLHYASREPADIIFGDELADMDPDQNWLRQYHYLSSERNRMTAQAILSRTGKAATKAHWYMCGPDGLKKDLQTQLHASGVPAAQIHSEVFATQTGPAYRVESRGGGLGGSLRVLETGATLDVQPSETLLTALERHGYHPSFSCRAGACGECKLKVTAGQVDPVGEVLSASEKADGFVLGCLAHPIGDVTIASGGRPPAGVARVAAVAGAGAVGRSAGAVALTRMFAVASVGSLVLTTWGFTNHRPNSWSQVSAAPQTSQTPVASPAGPGSGGSQGQTLGSPKPPVPTAAPSGGGGAPPAAPTATPKPKPVPVATSTPSPPPPP